MLFFLLYSGLSLFNAVALFYLYVPMMKPKIAAAIGLHKILQDWKIVINIYIALLVLMFKQWLNKTCTKIGRDKYCLQHCIGGKPVKIIVKKRDPEVLVVTYHTDDEIVSAEDAMPYLRYEQVQFSAPDINKAPGTLAITTASSYHKL